MGDVSEFYRLIDLCFSERRNADLQNTEKEFDKILQRFTDEFECDEEFKNEANREVASRILMLAIDKDLGLDYCMERWKRVEEHEFEDPIMHWLILCQVSRYFQRFKNAMDFRGPLRSVKGELEIELKGLQETIDQVSEELRTWESIVSENP